MAQRKIVWTKYSEFIFRKILEFYIKRNGTKTYCRKLIKEIKQYLKILTKQPFLGRPTDHNNLRVIIYKEFKIFYTVTLNQIIIHLIWDCRQNPDDLGIDL